MLTEESSPPASLSLTVRPSSGERFTVQVPSSDTTVGATKRAIEEAHAKGNAAAAADRLDASRQRLVYKGQILKDTQRLDDYGIAKGGSTLFLVMSGKKRAPMAAPPHPAPPPAEATPAGIPHTFRLTIRLPGGGQFAVEVPSSDTTVGDTKRAIEEAHARARGDAAADRLESSRQRLVHKGRVLFDDTRTLAFFGVVAAGSTLVVAMPPTAASTTAADDGSSSSPTSQGFGKRGGADANVVREGPWGSAALQTSWWQRTMQDPEMQRIIGGDPRRMHAAFQFIAEGVSQGLRQDMASRPPLSEDNSLNDMYNERLGGISDNLEMMARMSRMAQILENPNMVGALRFNPMGTMQASSSPVGAMMLEQRENFISRQLPGLADQMVRILEDPDRMRAILDKPEIQRAMTQRAGTDCTPEAARRSFEAQLPGIRQSFGLAADMARGLYPGDASGPPAGTATGGTGAPPNGVADPAGGLDFSRLLGGAGLALPSSLAASPEFAEFAIVQLLLAVDLRQEIGPERGPPQDPKNPEKDP